MKKIILASVLVVAATGSAHATSQSICAGIPSNAIAVTSSADTFVRVVFTPKCSNNVHLVGDDATTYYRVGGASIKGKNFFGGSSVGGAVQPYGTCAATGCTASDAVSGMNSSASS